MAANLKAELGKKLTFVLIEFQLELKDANKQITPLKINHNCYSMILSDFLLSINCSDNSGANIY